MAGHSKWANIRFRKAAQDAKRGKLFTKLIREITISARSGGGDPTSNPRLRAAIDKALAGNMTRDTIDRAIKRGTGELDGVNYEEVSYEGYASGGAAVLVECTTDNRNRTVGEVRHVFSKHGGNHGTDGSVAYLFNTVGVLNFAPGGDEDRIMDIAVGAGAEDMQVADDGMIDVITSPEHFQNVQEALAAAGFVADESGVTRRPTTDSELDEETAEKVLRLLGALEELDDVHDIYTNASFPNSIAAADQHA